MDLMDYWCYKDLKSFEDDYGFYWTANYHPYAYGYPYTSAYAAYPYAYGYAGYPYAYGYAGYPYVTVAKPKEE